MKAVVEAYVLGTTLTTMFLFFFWDRAFSDLSHLAISYMLYLQLVCGMTLVTFWFIVGQF